MYSNAQVDRVAKAILSERTAGHIDWRDLMESFRQEYRDQAIAALDAAGDAEKGTDNKADIRRRSLEILRDSGADFLADSSSDVADKIADMVLFREMLARGAVLTELMDERDRLREFVGDLEYYFDRWDGVPADVREWLEGRLTRLNAALDRHRAEREATARTLGFNVARSPESCAESANVARIRPSVSSDGIR